MSKLPLPDRGQPLDVSYIYNIANTVNQIASTISTTSYNYVSIDTPSSGTQNAKITDTRMIGGYVDIVSDTDVEIGYERAFSYDFPADFKYAPIVTVSPINVGNTPAGRTATVTLNLVTNSKVQGTVRFNSEGNVSIGINLIIIGIPN